MPHTTELLDKFPIISDQIKRPALEVVLGQLEKTLEADIQGDVAEFGCYIGTTSLYVRRLIDLYKSDKVFHVYDSFEGLPPKTKEDNSPVGADFTAGELAVSKKQFLEQFHRSHLKPPVTHKGWFNELTEADVPEHISFAFLDGDFYESILDSLRLVWPRMQPGGIVCIDDTGREALPGVDRAIRDFFKTYQGSADKNKLDALRLSHNIGIIRR
jgi:O-methyltransferase